jgi:hypothetical protein
LPTTTSKDKMAWRMWIATMMAISFTRQEAYQKKWRFIKTKWKMYTHKRLKKKPKKRWTWQHRMLWMWMLKALLPWQHKELWTGHLMALQTWQHLAAHGTTSMAEHGITDLVVDYTTDFFYNWNSRIKNNLVLVLIYVLFMCTLVFFRESHSLA